MFNNRWGNICSVKSIWKEQGKAMIPNSLIYNLTGKLIFSQKRGSKFWVLSFLKHFACSISLFTILGFIDRSIISLKSIYLSIYSCLSIYLYVSISIYLSIYPSIYLSVTEILLSKYFTVWSICSPSHLSLGLPSLLVL